MKSSQVYQLYFFTLLVMIACYFARIKQEQYILSYRLVDDKDDLKFLHYSNIVVVPIFQFIGMTLFGVSKMCKKKTDWNASEERLLPLRVSSCFLPTISWLAGMQFCFTTVSGQQNHSVSFSLWIPFSLFFAMLCLQYSCIIKRSVKKNVIGGAVLVFLFMFIWPFIDPTNRSKNPSVWQFFANCFAVFFITFSIVYVEKLLKTTKCTVQDVLFNMGWIGVIFCLFEALFYGLENAITVNVPVGYQYLEAVFGSWPDFLLTLARAVSTGFMMRLFFDLLKYSNSLMLWSSIGFTASIGWIIHWIRQVNISNPAVISFGLCMALGYSIAFSKQAVGDEQLKEMQEKHSITGMAGHYQHLPVNQVTEVQIQPPQYQQPQQQVSYMQQPPVYQQQYAQPPVYQQPNYAQQYPYAVEGQRVSENIQEKDIDV